MLAAIYMSEDLQSSLQNIMKSVEAFLLTEKD